MEHKELRKFSLLTLILIGAIILLALIINWSVDLDHNNYVFQFANGENASSVRSIQFIFDVDKGTGNISLRLNEEHKNLKIVIPNSTKISNTFLEDHHVSDVNYVKFTTHYEFDNLTNEFELYKSDNGKDIFIPIEGAIYPKGYFSFKSPSWRGDTIYLYSERFKCDINCFSNSKNCWFQDKGNLFLIRRTEEYIGQDISFDLNTRNNQAVIAKSIFSTLAISLIAGAIILIMQEYIEYKASSP